MGVAPTVPLPCLSASDAPGLQPGWRFGVLIADPINDEKR
jgi:hypothetical protein